MIARTSNRRRERRVERPAGRRKCSDLLNGHAGTNGAVFKVCFITREYPPNVYGGAGIHIKNLARELAQVMDVEVRCFGDQDLGEGRLRVKGYQAWSRMGEGAEKKFNSALGTFSTDLSVVRDLSTPTSCMATPGTPRWPASWPRCSTTSPSS